MLTPVERDAAVDAFFAATGAKIKHRGSKCYYVPSQDFIQIVPIEAFKTSHGYYQTLAHEAGRWSGHESRMNRKLSGRFATAAYAYEEFLAELTSCFVCAGLGIECEPDENRAAYIGSWINNKTLATILTDKPCLIVSAASEASKAADYLHSLQPQPAQQAAPGVTHG